jgi:drug/metabolite transporter (DMT)-like permease
MFKPDSRPYVWMLCGSFSFTLMAELAHYLTRQSDWQTVAVFRAGLVALFAAGMAVAGRAKLVFWPWRLWVRSIAGSASMLCTFYAFGKLPAADVVTLTNTFPIWVALLSWPLYGHFPNRKMILAILVGVSGVVLVEQPHIESGNLGVALALVAAALTAVAMLGLHSLTDVDPRAIVVHFSSVATVFCLTAVFVGPRQYAAADVLDVPLLVRLLGMGLTALIGQLFLTLAFSRGAPEKVSVVGLTQIVFTLSFDTIFLGRPLNAMTILGTLVIITPTAWLLARSRSAQSPENKVEDPITLPESIEKHPKPHSQKKTSSSTHMKVQLTRK